MIKNDLYFSLKYKHQIWRIFSVLIHSHAKRGSNTTKNSHIFTVENVNIRNKYDLTFWIIEYYADLGQSGVRGQSLSKHTYIISYVYILRYCILQTFITVFIMLCLFSLCMFNETCWMWVREGVRPIVYMKNLDL